MHMYQEYKMKDNTFLGDCRAVVYKATAQEVKDCGLTRDEIQVYIKGFPFKKHKKIPLRIASECMFGMFGDSHCDCESQRIKCLERIKAQGQGVYIHLPQEGQGQGLFYKAQELYLQMEMGMSVREASKQLLGDKVLDQRNYSVLKTIFESLNLLGYQYTFMGTNVDKILYLVNELGLEVEADNAKLSLTIENLADYMSKQNRLSTKDLKHMRDILQQTIGVPERVVHSAYELGVRINAGTCECTQEKLLNEIFTLIFTEK